MSTKHTPTCRGSGANLPDMNAHRYVCPVCTHEFKLRELDSGGRGFSLSIPQHVPDMQPCKRGNDACIKGCCTGTKAVQS